MKRMKQLLILLLILGLALGFRSFERIGTKSIIIPFSDGKEGMDPSEEADKEIKAVLLEEVESFSDLEISTIVLTEEKEPVSEKKQEQREEVSSNTSEGHSFSAGNEKQETKEPVSSGQNSQKQEEFAVAQVDETETERATAAPGTSLPFSSNTVKSRTTTSCPSGRSVCLELSTLRETGIPGVSSTCSTIFLPFLRPVATSLPDL